MSVDTDVVRRLKAREDERFRDAHPRSLDLLERARASMPNGVPMAWLADSGTYDHPPVWVTEGYSTLFREVSEQTPVPFDLVLVPGGVGSFAAAAVRWAAHDDAHPAAVVVEPATAACIGASLAAGETVTTSGGDR